ncbi:putative protein OS=Streptomyces violarus OX=67380 GN=FHS41_002533 PE=4 SV=1 [Streptomyces violarus]
MSRPGRCCARACPTDGRVCTTGTRNYWDFYDDRDDHTLDEADAWLTRIMPTTSQVTRERVAQVVGAWPT